MDWELALRIRRVGSQCAESQSGPGAGFCFKHLQRVNECLAGKENQLVMDWEPNLVVGLEPVWS